MSLSEAARGSPRLTHSAHSAVARAPFFKDPTANGARSIRTAPACGNDGLAQFLQRTARSDAI